MSGGERELVRWLGEQSLPIQWPVLVGIGDDMASVEIGADRPGAGTPVLLTSDMLLDGVHFRSEEHSFEQIGRKAIACSLSDCAGMAARPVAAVVSVAWPGDTKIDQAKRLFTGMQQVAGEFDCAVVGGDTTSWRNASAGLAVDVAMVASAYRLHPPVRRSTARPGDTLYVTGPLGGSLLGKHLTFRPRVRESHSIAIAMGTHLHAMMDISDGLAIDLHRMCESSGVGARLTEHLLEQVTSDDARRLAEGDGKSALEHALHDGEDFELLLAVAGDAPVPPTIEDGYLHPVGVVTESDVRIRFADGREEPLAPGGYEHLQ